MIPLFSDRPLERFPYMTLLLISVNISMFWYQLTGAGSFSESVMRYGMIPAYLFRGGGDISGRLPGYYTLLTGMFLHGGMLHLASNMLYLWVFGRNVEDDLGHVRFVLFYLCAGVVSSAVFALAYAGSTVPLVGASGAIAGVLGVYFLRFPASRIYTLFIFIIIIRIIPVPAFFLLGLWFLIQIMESMGAAASGTMAGVAWIAHVAGFVTGIVFTIWELRRRYYVGRR